MAFLQLTSNWQIAVYFIAGACIATILAMKAMPFILPLDYDWEIRELVILVNSSIVGLAAFVMAFAVVEARSSFTAIEANNRVEGLEIQHLDESLVRYGGDKAAAIRRSVVDYTKSIIDDEWPRITRVNPKSSPRTLALLRKVSHEIAAIEPVSNREQAIYANLLGEIASLQRAHDKRVEDAIFGKLPALFYWVVGTLVITAILISGMFKMERLTVILMLIQNGILALMIAFIVMIDGPYRGETSLTPDPYQRALMVITTES